MGGLGDGVGLVFSVVVGCGGLSLCGGFFVVLKFGWWCYGGVFACMALAIGCVVFLLFFCGG